MNYDVIIVGAGAAGYAAYKVLTKESPTLKIAVFHGERAAPYNRCFIKTYCQTTQAIPQKHYYRIESEHLICDYAVRVDVHNKKVVGATGAVYGYDDIIIATGSVPRMPFSLICQRMSAMLSTYFSLYDSAFIVNYCKQFSVAHAVVIGGGLVGLEAAFFLKSQGVAAVTIIEQNKSVVSQEFPSLCSQWIVSYISCKGIACVLDDTVVSMVAPVERVAYVYTKKGVCVQAQLVIVAAGSLPSQALLIEPAPVYATPYGHIAINNECQTSVPHVYAAGDIALEGYEALCVGRFSWARAAYQGMIAARALLGSVQSCHPKTPMVTARIDDMLIKIWYHTTIFPMSLVYQQAVVRNDYAGCQVNNEGEDGSILRTFSCERVSLSAVKSNTIVKNDIQ